MFKGRINEFIANTKTIRSIWAYSHINVRPKQLFQQTLIEVLPPESCWFSLNKNYLKMTSLSYLTDFHLSNIYLLLKKLANAKLLVIGKLLADGNLLVDGKLLSNGKFFSVGKHLVDTKHLTSIKMSTDLTYLPDLTKIKEKLECWQLFASKVHTPKGRFKCRRLIVTAGAWVNHVLKSVGVHIPLKVTQEQVTYFSTPNIKDFTPTSYVKLFFF